jgi:Negative regulator of sigma F
MDIDHLIQALSDRAQPVTRLHAPWRRSAYWFAASLVYVGIVVAACVFASGGLPGSIEHRLGLELAAILATAITAALAAFSSVVPGRDRRFLLLPLVPLGLWLATLGHGCPQDWQVLGSAGLQVRADWDCALPALILGALPAGAMLVMLRRGAPLIPAVSLALGALAAAAMANFGLRIFHAGDVSIQILVWHAGGAVIVAMIAGSFGSRVLDWRAWIARECGVGLGRPLGSAMLRD